MIEKTYTFESSEKKLIERIISDENVDINHVVLESKDSLPEHYSNSNVYLIILKGKLTISLNDSAKVVYASNQIINVPYNTKMHIANEEKSLLEFFIVKAPSPKTFN